MLSGRNACHFPWISKICSKPEQGIRSSSEDYPLQHQAASRQVDDPCRNAYIWPFRRQNVNLLPLHARKSQTPGRSCLRRLRSSPVTSCVQACTSLIFLWAWFRWYLPKSPKTLHQWNTGIQKKSPRTPLQPVHWNGWILQFGIQSHLSRCVHL